MGAPGRPGSRSWIPPRLLRYAGFSVGLPARWLDWFLRLELLLGQSFSKNRRRRPQPRSQVSLDVAFSLGCTCAFLSVGPRYN